MSPKLHREQTLECSRAQWKKWPKNGKTTKTAKKRQNGKKRIFWSQLGVFALHFVFFGLVLMIFDGNQANLAMNPQKSYGRLLLRKIRKQNSLTKLKNLMFLKSILTHFRKNSGKTLKVFYLNSRICCADFR
jgi:hypothetical protein